MSYILTSLLLLMMIRSIMLSDQGRFHQIIWLGFFSRLFLLVVTVTDIMHKTLTIQDKEYLQWVKDLGRRYRRSQIKAAVRVNEEMLAKVLPATGRKKGD